MSSEAGSQLERSRAELRTEKARAKAWLRTNKHKLAPVVRRERIESDQDHGEFGRTERLVQMWEGMEDEPTVYDEKQRFVPIQGRDAAIDVQSAAMSARVAHVLSFLSEEQGELLRAYYLEGRSLNECRKHGEHRQVVLERLLWARRAFLKAWRDHAADEIELKEEDF
jgi:hypothetical protein